MNKVKRKKQTKRCRKFLNHQYCGQCMQYVVEVDHVLGELLSICFFKYKILGENSRLWNLFYTVKKILRIRKTSKLRGENFKDVDVMVVPMNWTLLVCSVQFTKKYWLFLVWRVVYSHPQAVYVKRKRRLYFDPLSSKERKIDGRDSLFSLIAEIKWEFLS